MVTSKLLARHRVLVTGGAGYIGSHTVHVLLNAGAEVVVFDNLSTGHRRLVDPRAILEVGDVNDSEFIEQVIQKHQIKSVIHFAAYTSVEESVRLPEKYYLNNLGGTISLLKACQKTSVGQFIFSSTAAVYADPGDRPVTEEALTQPPTAYGRSKLMSEVVIRDVARVSGLKYVILRYFNVAGASATGKFGQVGDQHTVLIKRAALAAAGKIQGLSVFGTDYPTNDGTALRDFIHVCDLADIHVKALEQSLSGKASAELYNCGYGRGYSVKEIIDTMQTVSGVRFAVKMEDRRPGDLPQVIADSAKLKRAFDWVPAHDSIVEICKSAYQWELSELASQKKDNV